MSKQSAGILLFRLRNGNVEIFLVHPGGPYFLRKDLGSWSIPKGEFSPGEDALEAARREFFEETGFVVNGECKALLPVVQKSGKTVYAWAVEGDIDEKLLKSNFFTIEWPPRSGKRTEFPEVDKGEWFSIETAKLKINAAQVELLDQFAKSVSPGI